MLSSDAASSGSVEYSSRIVHPAAIDGSPPSAASQPMAPTAAILHDGYNSKELASISEAFVDPTLDPPATVPAPSASRSHHPSAQPHQGRPNSHRVPLASPCFVHSHLDDSLSLGRRQEEKRQRSKSRNRSKSRRARGSRGSDVDDDSEAGDGAHVAEVLAATAISVREMSKELGAILPPPLVLRLRGLASEYRLLLAL